MSKQPTPKQRRSQRGSVEDRWRKRIKDADGNSVEVAVGRCRPSDALARPVRRRRWPRAHPALRPQGRRPAVARQAAGRTPARRPRRPQRREDDGRGVVRQVAGRLRHPPGSRPSGRPRCTSRSSRPTSARCRCPRSSRRTCAPGRSKLKKEGSADSYVYAIYSRFSQIFTDAVHDGIVARNPCSRRTSPGMGKQRPYVATTRQVWALYDAVPPGVRPAILLGAHAGLRLAEAAALRVTDVDFATGVVTPSVQWENEPLKSDTSRTRSRSRPRCRSSSPRRSRWATASRSSVTCGATPAGPGRSNAPSAPHEPRSACPTTSGSTTCGTTSPRC